MMNKILSKTVNKKSLFLMSAIIAVLIIASVVVSAICGVNYGATTDDMRTVTVTASSFFYDNNLDDIKTVCEEEFAEQGLKTEYFYKGNMNGDTCEIVYVFESNADVAVKVAAAKKGLQETFAEKTADDGEWSGWSVSASSGNEVLKHEIPRSYVFKAVGAVALFAVLAFIYVAIRYRLSMGLLALVAPLVSAGLTSAIVLLTRIPVTNAAFYAIAVSALVAAVFALFTCNKIRSALREEDATEKSAEETVVNGTACKEILLFTAVLGAALVLMGVIATTAVRWFAVVSLIGLIVAAFVGLIFVPALYLPFQKRANEKAAQKTASGYVGAKKQEEEQA